MTQEFALWNVMVERTIQTGKRILLKCLKSGDDKDLLLLALRTASGKEKTPSPATKLMKHELRTLLPRIKEPTYQDRASKQTTRKHKKTLLTPEHQRSCSFTRWQNLVKKEESNQPKSYLTLKGNGRKFSRSRRHMLAIPQSLALRIFQSTKRPNTSPPEILEHQPTATEQMVRTETGKKSAPTSSDVWIHFIRLNQNIAKEQRTWEGGCCMCI